MQHWSLVKFRKEIPWSVTFVQAYYMGVLYCQSHYDFLGFQKGAN